MFGNCSLKDHFAHFYGTIRAETEAGPPCYTAICCPHSCGGHQSKCGSLQLISLCGCLQFLSHFRKVTGRCITESRALIAMVRGRKAWRACGFRIIPAPRKAASRSSRWACPVQSCLSDQPSAGNATLSRGSPSYLLCSGLCTPTPEDIWHCYNPPTHERNGPRACLPGILLMANCLPSVLGFNTNKQKVSK